MKIERRYTTADHPVADQIEWKTVRPDIAGKVMEISEVEVPSGWSQRAVNILADKYLRKAGVPSATLVVPNETDHPLWLLRSVPAENATLGPETSAGQVFHRMAGCWTYWGWCKGYFDDLASAGEKHARGERAEDYAQAFYDEVYMMLARQVAAPNSPQWFNSGLFWAYGIAGPDSGMWACDDEGTPRRVHNSYERPQPHACFLTPISDDLVNPGGIMDTWVREARIFKHGSGSGINPSNLRAKGEKLSGGGYASGLMSWLEIGDRSAGAIHSGGTTRRAAKLICVDDDHPEIEDFIGWKVREEAKATALYVGSQLMRNYYLDVGDARADPFVVVPPAAIDRLNAGFEPEIFGVGWEEEGIRTVSGQNSNNSIRVTNAFLDAADKKSDWELKARTTGETMKTVNAGALWDSINLAAWASADPGLIFHDTVNAWNTCAVDGVIRTSNPCVEFHHLDGSACNLASLNLAAFHDTPAMAGFDHVRYQHACRLWTIVLDLSVSLASFPAKEFAVGAWKYRTLGLGYANAGGLLRRLRLRYDSDDGRALIAGLTAVMTGIAYRTSVEMAEELGPFPRWEANRESMLAVVEKHRSAIKTTPTPNVLGALAQLIWDEVQLGGCQHGFRNAQVTLIAPTGTISFVMDCDTTGIEPYPAPSVVKSLAGGGTMSISATDVLPEDCAFPSEPGGPCLRPMAHVLMVAAVQPFLSGAVSKTVNLPRTATVADVAEVNREAHRLGLKAIALYRDGSKLTQPLNVVPREEVMPRDAKTHLPVTGALDRGVREPLPSRRRGETQKTRVGGQTVYVRTGEYLDGRLGEVFIDIAGAGSTLDGFANGLAKMTSIALQFGAPLSEVVDALLGTRFEPAGVVELHERVRNANSITDLVARDLAIAYLGREDLAHTLRVVAVDPATDGAEAIVAYFDKRAVAIVEGTLTGETCRRCGGLLRQSGTCLTCESCGDSEGGCG